MVPTEVPVHYFTAADGAQLVYRELGAGRPLILIHGLFSDAVVNWIKYGHAALLAEAGFRVIMPDLRAHGTSAKSHDAVAYPKDVLAEDGFALIQHLALTDYHLGGFSLGARTCVRMLVRGAQPRRVVLGGMGLAGLTSTGKRIEHFKYVLDNLGSFERGSEEWLAEAFLKTTKGDVQALRLLLNSFADTSVADIHEIAMPCAVICGDQDNDNGSADDLAAALPRAQRFTIPGTHMGCVVKRDLGEAIRDFLIVPSRRAQSTGPSADNSVSACFKPRGYIHDNTSSHPDTASIARESQWHAGGVPCRCAACCAWGQ